MHVRMHANGHIRKYIYNTYVHICAQIHSQMREKNVEALPLMHAVAEHLQRSDQKSAGDTTRDDISMFIWMSSYAHGHSHIKITTRKEIQIWAHVPLRDM